MTLTRSFEVLSRNWHRLVCDRCGQMLDTLQQPPIACAVAGCTGTMQERHSSDFLALIPADHLANIAKECPGALEVESGTLKEEPCVVIRHAQKTQATKNVSAGIMSSEFRLYTQPLEAFPPTAEVSAEFTVIKLGIRDLVEALRWALPALDKNSRWGLVLRQGEGCITVGATNGRVLSIFGGVKAENTRIASKAVVINWKIADRLLDVLEREIKSNPAAGQMEIRFEEEKDAFCVQGDQWRVSDNSIYRIVRAMGREALGRHVRPHGLRHSGITHALDKTNGNVRAVAKFARHARVDTTMIYDDNRQDIGGEIAKIVAE